MTGDLIVEGNITVEENLTVNQKVNNTYISRARQMFCFVLKNRINYG